ncbi:lipopolysaccharide biosynthesis protein [Flavobacterium arcticum]|uniref:Lipopolysaccharide biosynthesis protein n=1 Tax=Flavobacterium arcticum TaxID=1784713 RepID=A0A345H9A0_9FLAO|nr:lipopolysaccharide biosynthesis protein [Flavobacterium arcticum]AXG73160.1 lipopolysaccharide biosynthesis protein [Flavobacterium arcticum]KAF2512952.1 lipopolysaccharide biosynthesis protein [Flavobacterium arcticum]
MSKEVGNKTKKGLFWDLAGSFFRQFASVFISIILARLLSPEEFGVVGMALVFVSITEVFVDIGFTSGLIQRKEVKDIAYSSIFYVNLVISIILSLLIILIAPYVADFYEEPKVGTVLVYLALIPPIAAFGRVQSTILTKRMDFKSLSIRNIVATVVGGIAGVTGALLGMGVYSLVLLQIFTVLASTILLWSSTGWRPKWEFSRSEVRSLLGYSSYVFFDQALRQIFNKIDTIFIGKVFSTATLGFYSRAESLKGQIDTYTTNSLRKVMFPALSALQDNQQSFAKAYHRAFNIVTGVIVLLVGPIYFLSEEIIIGLLGAKWRPSIIFFQILLFATLTSPHIGMMAQAVLAKGYSKLKFNIGLIQRFLKLTPIVFGLWFGVVEFSMAVVGASTTVFFVYSYVVHKKLHLSFGKQMKDFFIPNILFLVFIVIFHLFGEYISSWVYAPLFFICNIIFLRLLKHESYYVIQDTFKTVTQKISKFKR